MEYNDTYKIRVLLCSDVHISLNYTISRIQYAMTTPVYNSCSAPKAIEVLTCVAININI
jgi:hypothetical protein